MPSPSDRRLREPTNTLGNLRDSCTFCDLLLQYSYFSTNFEQSEFVLGANLSNDPVHNYGTTSVTAHRNTALLRHFKPHTPKRNV